jgi:hypothetical protein
VGCGQQQSALGRGCWGCEPGRGRHCHWRSSGSNKPRRRSRSSEPGRRIHCAECDRGASLPSQGADTFVVKPVGCVAIGEGAVDTGLQELGAVAIGASACGQGQGQAAIAIGYGAENGLVAQDRQSIVWNATGAELFSAGVGTFVVKPVRGQADVSALPGLINRPRRNLRLSS